jgi:hypothetical protein
MTTTPLAVKLVTGTWVLAMWQYELVGAALTSDVSSVAGMSWDEQAVGAVSRLDEHSGIDMPAV